ncbi:MAG: Stk1 family PASTA domain-containing Ser/Thr kinase [Actinomycetia bacterium]|nr:Stk1 family PASTA domain-containing Ser/Thr kinase [Actinomycetes bacterium]
MTSDEAQPRRLADRYEIGEVIGRGGMAEVFEGRDLRLGRRVAVKLLRTDLARDPSFQARFRREAQSSAALNHPNVVATYDTGETDLDGVPVPFIVMEFVDGTTLRDMLKAGHRFLPDRALEIEDGVLAALDYSHRHGIIHRDIKPGNVMLSRTGQVKVMDFGIARAVADSAATMTQTSAILGTAQYLSPEQAKGEVVDARSDLYSAGCLLYELLTNRPPFLGDSPVSVAYQHVRESAAPPSQLNADVPPAADAIVMRALQKRPEDRYQTAALMRADVERARSGGSVAAVAPAATAAAAGAAADSTQVIPAVSAGAGPVPPQPARSRAGWYAVLGLAVVGALALAVWVLPGLFSGGDQVRVPDLSGLTVEQATTQLVDRGLALGTVGREPSDKPVDTVISQSPPQGDEVEKGRVVDLIVSSGPEQVTVPTLVGLQQEQAITALNQAGLVLGTLTPVDSDRPAGTVTKADPPEGTQVDRGSAVALEISSGNVKVPNVVGVSEGQARATIINAGFDVQVVTQETSSADPGEVIAQSPPAGTLLQQGRIVTITVAVAPPPSPSPSPTPTASASPSPSPSP